MTGPIVVRGRPSDAELAALTAVLLAAATKADDQPAPARPQVTWGSPRDRLQLPPTPGPHAWRTSFRH
ncbi:MAG: acyl-CoA carboxylase epsilon subunit [Micropruina sp.]|uniref:acyl-CoA carboxylase epsilon subunit n=1 Tax=Micropruina sp. TaxID=2737536 RepID=UPI0039E6D695